MKSNKFNSNTKRKTCLNCGKYGHVYRNCKYPLTSYGILLFYMETSANKKPDKMNIKYLMIRRRHTFGYVEFVRANFDIKNEKYIKQLIWEMTNEELQNLKKYNFNELWYNLWLNKNDHEKYNREYSRSKKNFEILISSNYYLQNKDISSKWETPEWGFPKGKRNKNENEITCAKREMYEETNLKSNSNYVINFDFDPIYEEFVGSDGRKYKHKYYIAKANDFISVSIDKENIMQVREVGDIQWLTSEDCIKIIRPYNVEKIEMFKKAHQVIINSL